MYQYTQIENFKLIRTIGTGAHGLISLGSYENEDGTNTQVAIKHFQPTCYNTANAEIQYLSKNIKHKNLIEHISSGMEGEFLEPNKGFTTRAPYLAMEYCPKGDFIEYMLRAQRFSERVTRRVIGQLLDGLEVMHQAGYFHGDVKPENMLVANDYSIKLTDFGFTDLISNSGRQYRGTPGYLAPEVIALQPYSGDQTDLFAVGVIAYIMIFGQRPFRSTAHGDNRYKPIRKKNWRGFWSLAPFKCCALFSDFIERSLAQSRDDRMTLGEMRDHPWMAGPKASDAELRRVMEKFAQQL